MKLINSLFSLVCIISLGAGLISCEKALPITEGYPHQDQVDPVDDNYRNYYEIFVSSFCDSNGDGVGDLKGITSKLPYLSGLGFSGIWLTPINTSPTYHKYDCADYFTIDPQFGTNDDFKELVSTAHELNIKVIIDLVINHSSTQNRLFIDAVNAHAKELSGGKLSESETSLANFYNFSPTNKSLYHRAPGQSFYYLGEFGSGMPDFNFDEPGVLKYFESVIDFYVNPDNGYAVDGFRMDAVKHFYTGNDIKSCAVISHITDYTKSVNPNAYIVGENLAGSYSVKTFYELSTADSFFNFTVAQLAPSYLNTSLARDGQNANDYWKLTDNNYTSAGGDIPAPFINNHDHMRRNYATDLGKTKLQWGLLSMLNGTTFAYYGDEIMMGHIPVSGSYADLAFRTFIPWGEAGDAGNCVNPMGNRPDRAGTYPLGSVKDNLGKEGSLTSYYRDANMIRNKYPEIARGVPTLAKEVDIVPTKDGNVQYTTGLVIKKEYNNETIYIAINFSGTANYKFDKAVLNGASLVDYLTVDGKAVTSFEGNDITLLPYTISLFK